MRPSSSLEGGVDEERGGGGGWGPSGIGACAFVQKPVGPPLLHLRASLQPPLCQQVVSMGEWLY